MDNNIDKYKEALRYAKSTLGIEGMTLTDDEEKLLIDHLLNNRSDGSFLYSIVKMYMESKDKGGENNVKNR